MFLFVHKVFRAAVTGSVVRDVTCEKCGCAYHYRLVRRGEGPASAPYHIGITAAKKRADASAQRKLQKRLATGHDPVACPDCGWFQRDMVCELRRRMHRWLTITGITLGVLAAIFLLITSAVATNGFSRSPRQDDLMVLAIMAAITVALCGGPMLLRAALLRRRNPNRAYPARPAPVPGAPQPWHTGEPAVPAQWELVEPTDGILSYQSQPPEVEPGGWLTLQLLNVPVPAECCSCMTEGGAIEQVPVQSLVTMPLRVCAACRRMLTRKKWAWILGSIAALALPMLIIASLSREFDTAGMVASVVVVSLFGAAIGVALASKLAKPARFGKYDPTLNTLRVRFRHPAYASEMIAQAAARRSDAPPPPISAVPMGPAIAIPRPVRGGPARPRPI